MYKHTLTAAVALASISSFCVHAADAAPQGIIEGSKASVSSRTMYYKQR
jgi:hypothetical protein